jgi:solute:Na+ symporter, SSS family
VKAGDRTWRILGIVVRDGFFDRHVDLVKTRSAALRYVALSPDAKGLAQDMYQALWSFVVCVVVTVVVSLATKPMADSELTGLVYGLTEVPTTGDVTLYQKPLFWAVVVTVVFFVLNIISW